MPYPAFMNQLLQPPPGYLAGPGGIETPAGVAGAPVPLGATDTLPNGMTSRPVSNPAAPPVPGNGPLDAIREQMAAINQMVGAAPQQPYVNHIVDGGSPTAGLGQLGGRMVGSQDQGRVGVDPGAALNVGMFNQLSAGRGQDQQTLLSRLGTMGSQALQGGDLNLRTIGLLGANGQQGSMSRDNALAASTIGANGLERQRDAQQAAFVNSFVQGRIANGGTLSAALRELRGLPGMSGAALPGFGANSAPPGAGAALPGAGMAPLGAGSPPVPPGAEIAGPGQASPPTPGESPSEHMESLYSSIQRNQTGVGPAQSATARINDPNAGITSFISGLRPGVLEQHTPEVMQFVIDRFGAPAADAWFTHRSSMIGRETPQEAAIRMVENAANRRVPGTVGSSVRNAQTDGPGRFLLPDLNSGLATGGAAPR